MSNIVNMHNCVTKSYSFSNVMIKEETTENKQENRQNKTIQINVSETCLFFIHFI